MKRGEWQEEEEESGRNKTEAGENIFLGYDWLNDLSFPTSPLSPTSASTRGTF